MEYISYLILAGAQINYLQFCFQFCLREKTTFVAKMTDVVLPVAVALSLCRLPSDSGPCGQWQKKYFYDHNAGHCRQFWYGGCGGTANRFNTMEDCSKICFVKKESGGGGRPGDGLLILGLLVQMCAAWNLNVALARTTPSSGTLFPRRPSAGASGTEVVKATRTGLTPRRVAKQGVCKKVRNSNCLLFSNVAAILSSSLLNPFSAFNVTLYNCT